MKYVKLGDLTVSRTAAGEHHNEEQMAMYER
jgi:hypothetical protein